MGHRPAGIVLYLRATRSGRRLGTFVFWFGITVLTWIWLVSLKGLPPPGSIRQVAISSLLFMGGTVAWAYWVDYLRSSAMGDRGQANGQRPTPVGL